MISKQINPLRKSGAIMSELGSSSRYSNLIGDIPPVGKVNTSLLRLGDVLKRIPVSRSTWYLWGNPKSPYYDPTLPKPVRLSKAPNGPVAWLESEIEEWILNRHKRVADDV